MVERLRKGAGCGRCERCRRGVSKISGLFDPAIPMRTTVKGSITQIERETDSPQVLDPYLPILISSHIALRQHPFSKSQYSPSVARGPFWEKHHRPLFLPPGLSQRLVHPSGRDRRNKW